MFHKRRWAISAAASAQALADLLTQHTWTRCTGFCVAGHEQYLFLNDATGEDAAQEYGVVKKPTQPGQPFLQLESITMSWCSPEKVLQYIEQALSGQMDQSDLVRPVECHIEPACQHRCHLCA